MTFRYWSGFSVLTVWMTASPFASKSSCKARMNASPSLLRDPGFLPPPILPVKKRPDVGSLSIQIGRASAALTLAFLLRHDAVSFNEKSPVISGA